MAVDDEVMSAVEVWAADDTSLDEFVEPEELAAEGEDSAVEGMGSTEEVCVDNASAVVDSTADDTVEVVSAGTVSVVMMLGLLMNVSVCVGL
jgi:hypothetical protein